MSPCSCALSQLHLLQGAAGGRGRGREDADSVGQEKFPGQTTWLPGIFFPGVIKPRKKTKTKMNIALSGFVWVTITCNNNCYQVLTVTC